VFNYAAAVADVPQSESLPGQVRNSAGGFSFPVDDWTRLERFLVMGSEGNTYYTTASVLTRENAKAVERCIVADGRKVVDKIVEVSDQGRAPKNDAALFALSMAAKLGSPEIRAYALASLPKVARIATHLYHFASFISTLGGWGRGTKRAFSDWYLGMSEDRLVYQAIKFQQRDGWSHADLLRLSHPKARTSRQNIIFKWMVDGWESVGPDPHSDPALAQIWAFEKAKGCSEKELIHLISDYHLPHECIPNSAKGNPAVWDAMLPTMGIEAMVRNLGKMTKIGLLSPLSKGESFVVSRLQDQESIAKARLHPLHLLVALNIYARGRGDKGSLTWSPSTRIVDALDASFYLAFKAVEPTNKRIMLALDVSGSMCDTEIAGMPAISPKVGSSAMALVTANVEPNHMFTAFTEGGVGAITSPSPSPSYRCAISQIGISPRQRLDDVCRFTNGLPFGGTDCALPMIWAARNRIPVDTFVIYTDAETWAGNVHPTRALAEYRQKMGIGARLVTVGMVSNGFTIADPDDAGQMDVVGFDTAAPALISDFSR